MRMRKNINKLLNQLRPQGFSLKNGWGGKRPPFPAPPLFKGKALGTRLLLNFIRLVGEFAIIVPKPIRMLINRKPVQKEKLLKTAVFLRYSLASLAGL